MSKRYLTYNPNSLVSMARKVINTELRYAADIDALEIPETLKRYLRDRYIGDLIFCSEGFVDVLDRAQTFGISFEQDFMSLSIDDYITLHYWDPRMGWPAFAYEQNHIINTWYEVRGVRLRYCNECIRYIREKLQDQDKAKKPGEGYVIDKWTSCSMERAEDLIDYMQCQLYWCCKCHTTALFRIEDWPWHTHRDQAAEITHTDYIGIYV
nr:MAG: nonstructural protein 3 [Parvoviridae sp.]